MKRLIDTDDLVPQEGYATDETDNIEDLSEKHGYELVEHMLFYGATQSELKQLSQSQVAMLKAAGMLR